MTKANENPLTNQLPPEPNWEAGVRRITKEGRLLALTPKPVVTGERAVDVNAWIRRKTEGWLDLQNGNLLFSAEFALMFLSLTILVMMGGLAMTVNYYLGHHELTWIPLLGLGGMNLLITVPWGLYVYFLGNKAVKETPPIRLNRQRREVAIPRWTEGKEFKLPFWNDSAAGIAYITYIGTIAAVFMPYTLEGESPEYVQLLVTIFATALAVETLVIGAYFFIALRLKKKHDPKLVYEFYPWDKLVAYIETRQDIGPSLMATRTVLTLAIPKPDDPESALAAATINVGHETAGLAQWECLRRFMEDGPEDCPDPKNDDTLAHYKARCRQARKEMSLLPWLGKKVGDWFFQRYLAHIITERRIKTLALKSLPKELERWSAPLPKEQWTKPSEALQSLNQNLTRAYERGLRFTNMGPVSEWQAGREAKRQEKRGRGRYQSKASS
ncbi:hypothetical protein [Marinobacter sp. DY40_1A1]|uniref:hypothetical protein n=1 Tax=Marinobacter sp. DY40_1A1 TaxID=2583229 RepID=UPI0019071407|nr:hypothetical protein [Marinobacter sp. DY40_1A1]MBK1886801.1 hypothetical protein [Marinobacter sp. DY40_1A1]